MEADLLQHSVRHSVVPFLSLHYVCPITNARNDETKSFASYELQEEKSTGNWYCSSISPGANPKRLKKAV